MTDSIPDDYDEWTVPDVRDHVADVANTATLDDLAAYEREHKDRVTALEAIEARRDELVPTEETPTEAGGRETAVVTTTEPYIGFLAGLHFEEAFEHKEVEMNVRIERAIENGDLRRVTTA